MPDFTSNFWSIFIIAVTVLSIVALFWLIGKFKGGKKIVPGKDQDTTDHVWDEDLREYNNPLPGWWLNLFYITIVFGIVYLVMYPGLGSYAGLAGWSQTSQYENEMNNASEQYGPIYEKYRDQDLVSLAGDPEALAIGKRLYSAYCTTCHGSDAGGARGFPNLRDNDWLYGGEPENIKTTILDGRSGLMPPWKGLIPDENISNVAEYVIGLSGRETDMVAANKGRQVYTQFCAVCHGADATGNQALGAPNLSDDYWLYGGSKKQIVESITLGRNGNMPPHKEFLGEAKAHLLAAYIYSLSQKK